MAIDPALPTAGVGRRSGALAHPAAHRQHAASVSLADQYVYGHPVTHAGLFAVAAYGPLLDVFLWNGGDLLAFTVAEPGA